MTMSTTYFQVKNLVTPMHQTTSIILYICHEQKIYINKIALECELMFNFAD